ncbi:MAG: murein DD-endopeptidase MepM/ murein hydrolase activator NlpD [Cellvibrionaceae bacterium]|jgi:murein DD-endopeptidase MepM/ murein hydrolase activator NlpD
MKRVILTAPFLLLLAALSGCSVSETAISESVAAAEIVLATTVTSTPDPTILPTAELPSISVYELIDGEQIEIESGAVVVDDGGLPSPVISTSSNGESSNSENGGLPTALPTVPAPTPTETATLVPATPAEVATPEATFTLPALGQTSAEDHYWMVRPIPEGGTVWTDKSYSYGSTKGGSLQTHHGVEFFVTYDTPVLAAADGNVVTAGWDSGADVVGPEPDFYGNVVVIEHDFLWQGEKVYSLYGHLNTLDVTKGQRVKAGEQIALSGASGIADGAHLHFEVRQGFNDYSSTRNPLLWLWPFPEDGTLAGKVTFENGAFAAGAPVNFRRIDGGDQRVYLASSYADEGVNGDTLWGENYAADDVDAGYYEVYVKVGPKTYKEEVWVYPRRTTFVDIVIANQ